MSKEKRRVPKLRFPGFTEDWEQRKLGAMCSLFIDGDWIESKDQSNEGIRLIQTGNIGVGKFIDKPENKKWISHSTFNNLRCKELLDGDILISRLPQPAGRACIVNTNNEKWITAVDCTIVRLLDQYSNKFILQSLCTYNYFHLIDSFLAGGTRQRVSRSNLSDINIMSPKKIEQDKIGLFFEYVDNLITLHQRKLEHLNLKKKALLQKLFPKDGERYPELRFPGFTDAWEQCKLNEFLSVSNLKNTEDKYNKKDVLSVSGDYGIVNQIEFQGRSFAGVSVSNYGVVETGDIVYTKSPLKLNPYGIIKTNRINNGIVSTLYAIYKTKENCDSKFIEHYFNLDSRLNKYLKPLVNKGAKNDMKVSSENALIGEVCFPHITEQKLIADFLDWLDVYITLHQRKLEDLQLQKKALLQQMFV